jgi:hypothetical protein
MKQALLTGQKSLAIQVTAYLIPNGVYLAIKVPN